MISMPTIQIRQQYARIGIDADPAVLEMRQPKATLEITTERPGLSVQSRKGNLSIDQSKAWDALAIGGNLEMMQQIYSEVKNIVLQTIGRIVTDGNRMAAIHEGTNAIAELARERSLDMFEFDFAGPASYDNVDITYTANKPEIRVIPGTVNIQVQPHKPEINARRGKLDIYMLQYNKVEITPPQIDLKR